MKVKIYPGFPHHIPQVREYAQQLVSTGVSTPKYGGWMGEGRGCDIVRFDDKVYTFDIRSGELLGLKEIEQKEAVAS